MIERLAIRRLVPLAAVLSATTASATITASAATHSPGQDVIHYASNGGLRDWQVDHADPSSLFVRDRTDHWFRVRLTGRPRQTSYATMVYTTDSNGDFDRFSTVSFPPNRPYARYGVEAITASAPPPQIRRATR